MPYPNSYPQDFISLVNHCRSLGDEYVGFGNPEAKMLIVGKECGHEKDSIIDQMEVLNNVCDWNRNINNGTVAPNDLQMPAGHLTGDKSQMPLWKNIFNPLWPYFGMPLKYNFRTWYYYQKLIDLHLHRNIGKNGAWRKPCQFDFFEYAFITELSALSARYSSQSPKNAKNRSVKNRLGNFFSHPYFDRFDTIILAVGPDYIDGNDICYTFKVQPIQGAHPSNNPIFSDSTGRRKVIWTYQFSYNTTSDTIVKSIIPNI